MGNCLCLSVPDADMCLHQGDHIRLGRFNHDVWLVSYGWYAWGGNRPVCGWYLINIESSDIKPLQLTDLDDIYVIEN